MYWKMKLPLFQGLLAYCYIQYYSQKVALKKLLKSKVSEIIFFFLISC